MEHIQFVCPHCAVLNKTSQELLTKSLCKACDSVLFPPFPQTISYPALLRHIAKDYLPLIIFFYSSDLDKNSFSLLEQNFGIATKHFYPKVRFLTVQTTPQAISRFSLSSDHSFLIFQDTELSHEIHSIPKNFSLLSWLELRLHTSL